MNLSRELIEKFFAGNCSEEESACIIKELDAQPELLDKYITREEWNEITRGKIAMPESRRKRTEALVLSKTTRSRQNLFLAKLSLVAAAACLLLVAGVWYKQSHMAAANNISVKLAEAATLLPGTPDTIVKNEGKDKMVIKLSDGSQVELYANSQVRYQHSFTGNKREIYLTGVALFNVAKNKLKPFIVHSHGVSTTALGTSFTIRALAGDTHVYVSLHTGKVVVKQEALSTAATKDIYLAPGDNVTVDLNTFFAEVKTANTGKTPVIKKEKTSAAEEEIILPLSFDRKPLDAVFQTLHTYYKVPITYHKNALKNLSFTGTIQVTDSIENILQNIAFLNDLIIAKTPKGYQVNTSH